MSVAAHMHHSLLVAGAILAFLIWQGIQATHTRTLPFWRLILTPCLFIALGVTHVVANVKDGPQGLIAWLVAAVLGIALAWAYAPKVLSFDPQHWSVTRPGSFVPLVRNIIVFTLQAGSAALASHPGTLGWRVVVSCAISGASAGYFIGWIAMTLRTILGSSARTGRSIY